jgi:hypothetical protein
MSDYTRLIIISLLRVRPSDLLRSNSSVCVVSPKILANLIGNREFGMRFLSGEFQEHVFSS